MRFAAVLLLMGLPLTAQTDTELGDVERLLSRNEFPRAVEAARTYAAAHPDSVSAHNLAARALIGQGQFSGAFVELRTALALAPRDTDALYFLMKLSTILAGRELETLYRLAPDSARVHQLLAEAAHARADQASEKREYETALARDPHSVDALTGLGDLARVERRLDDGVEFYKRALAQKPTNYDALYGLGACRLFLDQPEQAIEYFRRSIAVDPASEAAQFALGDALIRVGKPEEALAALKAALRLNPRICVRLMRCSAAPIRNSGGLRRRPKRNGKFLELSDQEMQREQNQRPEKP